MDRSIYYASLEDWPHARAFRTRISGRLAREIPLRLRRLRNTAPMVSFTFDDVPDSALDGAELIESAGARGTFYISTALLGLRADHWRVIDADGVRELHRRGHEIGLHGHRHLPIGLHSASSLAEDIAQNKSALRAVVPGAVAENFAYPYGQLNFARKRQLAKLVKSSRDIRGGVNRGFVDPQLIGAVALADSRLGAAEVERHLDEAAAVNGWLVFLTHDVADQPSPYGVSRRLLSHAIEGALRRGLRIETLDAALRHSRIDAPAPIGVFQYSPPVPLPPS
ncbi:MAG TPA: polysaccharide deacetylase family protein [Methylosinus sp.]|jgi:peptidoglycan/xylan/chitin deacetylase (PgdA/CDA1 family)